MLFGGLFILILALIMIKENTNYGLGEQIILLIGLSVMLAGSGFAIILHKKGVEEGIKKGSIEILSGKPSYEQQFIFDKEGNPTDTIYVRIR